MTSFHCACLPISPGVTAHDPVVARAHALERLHLVDPPEPRPSLGRRLGGGVRALRNRWTDAAGLRTRRVTAADLR